MERVLNRTEKGYRNLTAVAAALTATSPNNARYELADIWCDYGAGIMWTTIVRYGFRECQILSPTQWRKIVAADTVADIFAAVEMVKAGDYFGDK